MFCLIFLLWEKTWHFYADYAIRSSLSFSANEALSVQHRCSCVTDYKRTIRATLMLLRDRLQTHCLGYSDAPAWPTTNALYGLHWCSPVIDYKCIQDEHSLHARWQSAACVKVCEYDISFTCTLICLFGLNRERFGRSAFWIVTHC